MFQLQVGDSHIHGQAAIAQAAFDHFTTILGTSVERTSSIDLDALDPRSF